eukprot:COSAG05_NODE_690_length_7901_cov_174.242886_4_plen_82_part_00
MNAMRALMHGWDIGAGAGAPTIPAATGAPGETRVGSAGGARRAAGIAPTAQLVSFDAPCMARGIQDRYIDDYWNGGRGLLE